MNHSGCVCSDESLVEESRTFESRFQSLLHDTIQESENSMEVRARSRSLAPNNTFLTLLLSWCRAAAWWSLCCFSTNDVWWLLKKHHPAFVFVPDVEWVDVAAWKPEFLQWPLLNWVSFFAHMWSSAASVWMGCQTTRGCGSSSLV